MNKKTQFTSWGVAIMALVAPLLLALPTAASAQALWVEGRHYTLVRPAVPTSTPGKVEVVEVFSYGCPGCYQAEPWVTRLAAGLPATAQMVYVHASFNPSEAWPMLQRAFVTAQSLGIAAQNHTAMFEAIWSTGELPLVDLAAQRMRKPLPTIADAARFYARRSKVTEADFIKASQSFDVDTKVRRSDELVRVYRVPSTPTIVVNGKYLLGPNSAGGYEQMIKLVNYLVTLESQQARKTS
jgi:thiol:disulfide interchange protein DsbA